MSSFRKEKHLGLTGYNFNNSSIDDLEKLAHSILKEGVHGLCFSAYVQGQKPGDQLTRKQIHRRMEILSPYTKWIRTFSCTDGNELIPQIAKEFGLKTLVGAWLGSDSEKNQEEISGLIKLAKNGVVDIAAVGNEVLYRHDLNEEELLHFIQQVKNELPDIPVGYVDAYYEFSDKPKITEACDVILANCYPFWEGCDALYALPYMKDMYHQALNAGNGKKVIITETGWPDKGGMLNGAKPSKENYLKYFINSQIWSKQDGIEMFYFSSFDEAWKVEDEGDVGSAWGLWDKDELPKF